MIKFIDHSYSQSARFANYTSPSSAQPSYYQASPSCAAQEETVWYVAEPVLVPSADLSVPREDDHDEGP